MHVWTVEIRNHEFTVEFGVLRYVPANFNGPSEGGEAVIHYVYLGDEEVSDVLAEDVLLEIESYLNDNLYRLRKAA